LLPDFDDRLIALEPRNDDHRALVALLLAAAQDSPLPTPEDLARRGGSALAALRALPHVAIAPILRPNADPGFARQCLTEDFATLLTRRAMRRELDELTAEFDDVPGERLTWRLGQTAAALDRVGRGTASESTTDLGEDRQSLSNHLQSLIDSQVWVKNRRKTGPP
jgi:DNA primase